MFTVYIFLFGWFLIVVSVIACMYTRARGIWPALLFHTGLAIQGLALMWSFAYLFIGTAHADEWTNSDKGREIIYQSVAIVDALQTHTIAHDPERRELNSVLGEHPTNARTNEYFALCGLAHLAVSNTLSGKWREAWQYMSIGIEGGVVARNYNIGVNGNL